MFSALIVLVAIVAIGGAIVALDGSRDVFHPLVILGPMLAFLYAWMPWKLELTGGLSRFFDHDQMIFVQSVNLLSVFSFVVCCLAAGVRFPKAPHRQQVKLSKAVLRRLLIGGAIAGVVGLLCWTVTIVNVGGFVNAFSTSYAGGWDDSGYIRDGSILLLVGVLTASMSLSAGGSRWLGWLMLTMFALPWAATALFMARRGPTFELVITALMGWFMVRRKRPPLAAVLGVGIAVGWVTLFLVSNRQSIYLGSDLAMSTDVSDIVEKPDTGNEWIYGAGSMLAAERSGHFYWMRRYLAQVFVRAIPSSVWPNKYEDVGVPELLYNAGTDQGIGDALGWEGAVGSAPGIVSDLWAEVWWLCIPFMGLIGYAYGCVWKKAVTEGGAWSSQLVILSAISIYLVMQTMEAVMFRVLLMSIPIWIIWRWAGSQVRSKMRKRKTHLPNAVTAELALGGAEHA